METTTSCQKQIQKDCKVRRRHSIAGKKDSAKGSKSLNRRSLTQQLLARFQTKYRDLMYQPTLGEELKAVKQDHVIQTKPEENKRRRTVCMRRTSSKQSWGFTIQSYGIHHQKKNEVELLTYVDYVDIQGPSNMAGLRPGDVILSINGISMESAEHGALVSFIQNCGTELRAVVLFENCVRKVELNQRQLKLQKLMAAKEFELRSLELQERRVLEGRGMDPRRLSMASSSYSSSSSMWDDRLSLRPELDICPSPLRGRSPSPRIYSSSHSLGGSTSSTSDNGNLSLQNYMSRDYSHSSLPVSNKLRPPVLSFTSVAEEEDHQLSPRNSLKRPQSNESFDNVFSTSSSTLPSPSGDSPMSLSPAPSSCSLSIIVSPPRTTSPASYSPTQCSTSVIPPMSPVDNMKPEEANKIMDTYATYPRSPTKPKQSASLSPVSSQSSISSPPRRRHGSPLTPLGGGSVRLKSRTHKSYRSSSFKVNTRNPKPLGINYVLTEDNTRQHHEPLLIKAKFHQNSSLFRMTLEQFPTGSQLDMNMSTEQVCDNSDHVNGNHGNSVTMTNTLNNQVFVNNSLSKEGQGVDWIEMDTLSSRLKNVCVSTSTTSPTHGRRAHIPSCSCKNAQPISNGYTRHSGVFQGSNTVDRRTDCKCSCSDLVENRSHCTDLMVSHRKVHTQPAESVHVKYNYAYNPPLLEHINEADEQTVM